MEGETKKRKVTDINDEDEEDEDVKIEKFFALIRSAKDIRDQLLEAQESNKSRPKKAVTTEKKAEPVRTHRKEKRFPADDVVSNKAEVMINNRGAAAPARSSASAAAAAAATATDSSAVVAAAAAAAPAGSSAVAASTAAPTSSSAAAAAAPAPAPATASSSAAAAAGAGSSSVAVVRSCRSSQEGKVEKTTDHKNKLREGRIILDLNLSL